MSRTRTASELVWGVEPVPGETCVYFVQSKTSAGTLYRVDVLEFNGNGSCTCPKFMDFGIRTRMERGTQPESRNECEHIRRANRFFIFEIKHAIIAEQKRIQKERLENDDREII